ncbi:glycoside hydrolase family 16 protein [Pluteus cervinus]|uniref:Glycoside hydrolase family 16 protein n=1 Tax=Pluteus cervinus TaxID=181527 RepID=A0ACD3AN80_9AGAR|nr:glycoside hydrolase family 16 protein [Pluteus cervinus]
MTPSTRRFQQRMKSHMITDFDNVPKPWLENKRPRDKFAYWIVYVLVFIGLAGGAVQAYFSYSGVLLDRQPLCLVMEENFDSQDAVFGDNGSFVREVSMDGFGNGEFSMATDSNNNSYVQDGKLYIVPTLTSDNLGNNAIFDGTIYNITGCTFNETQPNNGFLIGANGDKTFDTAGYTRACSAVSNKTSGAIINPVQSARLTTRGKSSLKFGRVEIRAKMPNGYMWPALWMLPVDNVYGPWPLSGEIDIVESRGNGIRYTARGSNYVQGSLNWGPTPQLNGVSKTYSWWSNKRVPFSDDFHTYALEWTDKFIRMYVDTRLHTLLELKLDKPFFQRGDFPAIIFNGSNPAALQNPWVNGTNATPFDQDFYLILNVAVGGTNGWFPESQGNKPWLDNAANPMRDFANAISQWYPTWPTNVEDRAMVVDYVKMWKHC